MTTNRQLIIELRKEQNTYALNIQTILAELNQADPDAALLPIEKAVASRSLIRKLWDALPDEQDSFGFNSLEEQTLTGKALLPASDLRQTVTMHLGWDVLSFSCTLEAAWDMWQRFAALSTENFNCCIYPAHLEWYIVRAGTNLYPMLYALDGYKMVSREKSL